MQPLRYFDTISEYINTGTYPQNLTAHCCNIREQFSATENPALRAITDSRGIDHNAKDLGGCLYFPQWDALVPTSFNTMSVHGLGEEKDSQLPASYHCLLPQGTHASINTSHPIGKPIFMRVPIKLPHLKDNARAQVFFCYVTIVEPSSRPFNPADFAGRNNPPAEWLKDGKYYDFADVPPKVCKQAPNRVSILLGKNLC